jgi:secernin
MEADGEDGLLGMDLLRLALERAATARQAIDVITDLLARYGQKANACLLFHRTYENTFILADAKECWVLETAGREWAAKRLTEPKGISNCYTIGAEYDLASPHLEEIARQKRWQAPDEPFDFAKAYTGRLLGQPMGVQRYRRLNKCLALQDTHDFSSLARILRDHHDGELIEPRFGETAGTFMSVCMHMRDFGEQESVASLLTRIDGTLGIIARYAPAQPCLSAYIPVYMTALPEAMQSAEKIYDEGSLWWQMKALSLLVAVDEDRFAGKVREELAALEADFAEKAVEAEDAARTLFRDGKAEEAKALLARLTEDCTAKLFAFATAERARLTAKIREMGGLYGRQKEAIEAYAAYAEIPLPR